MTIHYHQIIKKRYVVETLAINKRKQLLNEEEKVFKPATKEKGISYSPKRKLPSIVLKIYIPKQLIVDKLKKLSRPEVNKNQTPYKNEICLPSISPKKDPKLEN